MSCMAYAFPCSASSSIISWAASSSGSVSIVPYRYSLASLYRSVHLAKYEMDSPCPSSCLSDSCSSISVCPGRISGMSSPCNAARFSVCCSDISSSRSIPVSASSRYRYPSPKRTASRMTMFLMLFSSFCCDSGILSISESL